MLFQSDDNFLFVFVIEEKNGEKENVRARIYECEWEREKVCVCEWMRTEEYLHHTLDSRKCPKQKSTRSQHKEKWKTTILQESLQQVLFHQYVPISCKRSVLSVCMCVLLLVVEANPFSNKHFIECYSAYIQETWNQQQWIQALQIHRLLMAALIFPLSLLWLGVEGTSFKANSI
jgi:hypothetical protein